jgi:muconate cycloisomerase
MIVQRIQCYHYTETFKVPFHSPQFDRRRADSVIVCLDCGAAGCGWGESAPRPYVTGESVQSVLTLWQDVFAPLLFQHPFDCLEEIETVLAALEAACWAIGQRAYHSALGAADLALIDVLGRSGGLEEEALFPINGREKLRFSVSVPFLEAKVIEKFFPILNAGFDNPIIKLLIGEDSDLNYRRLELLRRLAGDEAEIRLEANGKLGRDQAAREIDRLRPFHPAAIEQPLPAGDREGLRRLRQACGLRVIVDESLVSLEDAQQLLAAQACDIFNLKISKCGGLLRSRAIAQLAAQAGIDCQVGTHVGESELLGSAGRQLARGIPNFDCYGGGSQVLFSQLLEVGDAAAAAESIEAARGALVHQSSTMNEIPALASSTLCLDIQTDN